MTVLRNKLWKSQQYSHTYEMNVSSKCYFRFLIWWWYDISDIWGSRNKGWFSRCALQLCYTFISMIQQMWLCRCGVLVIAFILLFISLVCYLNLRFIPNAHLFLLCTHADNTSEQRERMNGRKKPRKWEKKSKQVIRQAELIKRTMYFDV